MKLIVFITTLCFFLNGSVTTALNPAVNVGPSIPFSPEIALMLFGTLNPNNPKGILNCEVLVAHSWPYANSQVSPLCTDAEVACLRFGLIHISLKRAKGAQAEALKKDYSAGYNDVMLRLRGCQLAIEATTNTNSSLVEAAGFSPSSAEENRP